MFVELIAPDPVGPELTRSIGIAIAVHERGRQETTIGSRRYDNEIFINAERWCRTMFLLTSKFRMDFGRAGTTTRLFINADIY